MSVTLRERERNTTTGPETHRESASQSRRWAVILAGGDGKRLLPLTRRISGDDRPKQFCNVLGTETLLDQTLRRVGRVVSPQRTFSVVTKAHEKFYSSRPYGPLLVQPRNRGTGPAIIYSLARLSVIDPQATVAFLPSDHHFPDEEAFSACVNQAFEFGESHGDAVVLLGIKPTHPETGYGWIEPGKLVRAPGPGFVHSVRGFWEKPSAPAAAELIRRGCLWNSFVMAGRVESLLSLIRNSLPDVFRSFQELAPALFTAYEEAAIHKLYQNIEPSNFSKDVLSVCSRGLAVLYSTELEWSDIGDVERALSLMGRRGPGASRKRGSGIREMAQAIISTA